VETPSASPGASRRASPVLEPSPTLAPDSTTQMTYDYGSKPEYRISQPDLNNALGHDQSQSQYNSHSMFSSLFGFSTFPGPYHPDVLQQHQFSSVNDALPYVSMDSSDVETMASPSRSGKRRRMSTDSASEPPSSATSYSSSFNDGYSSASSATSHSQRSPTEFPFSPFPSYNALHGSTNMFWHPPMLPHESGVHPPMLPVDDCPMDYLHPPMVSQDEDSIFSTYLHPPMVPADEHSPAPMSSLGAHPPMFPSDSFYLGSDFYESNMRTY